MGVVTMALGVHSLDERQNEQDLKILIRLLANFILEDRDRNDLGELAQRVEDGWGIHSEQQSLTAYLNEELASAGQTEAVPDILNLIPDENGQIVTPNAIRSYEVEGIDMATGPDFQPPSPEPPIGPSGTGGSDSPDLSDLRELAEDEGFEFSDSPTTALEEKIESLEDRLANVELTLNDIDAKLNRLQKQRETSVQIMVDYCEG